MLEFIKKYRSNPKRLVLTLKLNECICLNRLGDLNTARRAKIMKENEDKSTVTNDSAYNLQGQASDKQHGGEAQRAFKEHEECSCLDNEMYIGQECDCGCKEQFFMPCASFDAKGGFCSEKTLRVLLCDVAVASMLMLGGCMLKGMVLKKKRTR